MGAEEIRHISRPEELLRFLKNMKILSVFAIARDRNIHGDFESSSFVQKSGIPNEWLLKDNCGDIGLFEDTIVYYLTGPEWDEIVFRSIKHEIHSYVKFMDRNPIYYQEESIEEE